MGHHLMPSKTPTLQHAGQVIADVCGIIVIIEITHQTRCIHVDLQKRITINNVNYRVQAWCKSVSSSQGRNPGIKTELFNSFMWCDLMIHHSIAAFYLQSFVPSQLKFVYCTWWNRKVIYIS